MVWFEAPVCTKDNDTETGYERHFRGAEDVGATAHNFFDFVIGWNSSCVITSCNGFLRANPFCTIEPTMGIAAVLDERLEKTRCTQRIEEDSSCDAGIHGYRRLSSWCVEWQGLGSKFLANIPRMRCDCAHGKMFRRD